MKLLSRVQLFATPWTVAYQAPGPWDFPGKNTGLGCHFLLQGIFPTQGSNTGLLNCRQTLYRLRWRVLIKLKIELLYDLAIPLLGIYPEKTIIQKDTCTPMYIAALFTIAKRWMQSRCPSTDEWI